MIEIFTIPTLADNYTYALVASGRAAIVDPGEAAPVRAFLAARNLGLTHVLLTHHHADHVGGAADLRASSDCEVWCSSIDRERLAMATRGLVDGEGLSLFGEPLVVIATPGHTRGQICYHLPNSRAVFTGDTLFSAGCGRLFEGDAAEMFRSMRKLDELPADTRVYFGHEYTVNNLDFVLSRATGALRGAAARVKHDCAAADQPTTPSTIACEREINPFLRARTVNEFAEWRSARDRW